MGVVAVQGWNYLGLEMEVKDTLFSIFKQIFDERLTFPETDYV